MAEQTMSSEGRKQVAISMCSTPSGRSLAATAAGGASPRSSTAGAKLVPLESFMKGTANSHYDDQDQEVPLVKKVAAEFIGTLILVFTVLSTVVANAQHEGTEGLLGVAVSAGLAVVAVVLSVVHISGSHLNPAVSLAMAVFGHLPLPHLLPYAAAQTLASGAAAFLARALYHPAHPAVMATVPADVVGVAEAFFLELVLAFVLMFVITAVATDPTSSKELIAIAIASTITMNALVGGPSTGPSMNPARTIGAAVATGVYKDIWVYLLATPLGAIAGAGAYTLIKP